MTVVPGTSTVGNLQERFEQAKSHNEILQESLVDAQLALESRGWERIGSVTGLDEFDKAYLNTAARRCRTSSVVNPLIGRAINLRIAYVPGSGVEITARASQDASAQDINAVIQGFLDDPLNRAAFTSDQAREENERVFATDGNVFLVLVTSPLTGHVQVRSVPFTQADDIARNRRRRRRLDHPPHRHHQPDHQHPHRHRHQPGRHKPSTAQQSPTGGVDADGIAGPDTINALEKLAGYVRDGRLDPAGSNNVRKIQARIKQQLGTVFIVDGLWCPSTAIHFHD